MTSCDTMTTRVWPLPAPWPDGVIVLLVRWLAVDWWAVSSTGWSAVCWPLRLMSDWRLPLTALQLLSHWNTNTAILQHSTSAACSDNLQITSHKTQYHWTYYSTFTLHTNKEFRWKAPRCNWGEYLSISPTTGCSPLGSPWHLGTLAPLHWTSPWCQCEVGAWWVSGTHRVESYLQQSSHFIQSSQWGRLDGPAVWRRSKNVVCYNCVDPL